MVSSFPPFSVLRVSRWLQREPGLVLYPNLYPVHLACLQLLSNRGRTSDSPERNLGDVVLTYKAGRVPAALKRGRRSSSGRGIRTPSLHFLADLQ